MRTRKHGAHRAALLLGAFDPPTNAHIEIVETAGEKTGLSPVLCVTKTVLAREHEPLLTVEGRNAILYEIAERLDLGLAFASSGRYLDVARALRDQGVDATFVVGADKLSQLRDPSFYEDGARGVDATFDEVGFVVVPRGDRPIDVLSVAQLALSDTTTAAISGTEVRRLWRSGQPIDHLVPPEVVRHLHGG